MTRTFLTDGNNDLYTGRDGRLAIGEGVAAVMAAVQTAVQAQLGEMVLAITDGMPNFQTVWSSAANVAQFEAYLRRITLGVDGVKAIESLEIVVQNNVLSYTMTVSSIYGSGTLASGI